MSRPSKTQVIVNFLELLQERSTCKRLQVAALITDRQFNAIYAMGYNGPARGEDNDACRGEEGACGCVHAEANALVKLRTEREGLLLITTTSPCELCAKLIVNCTQVRRMAYLEEYRDSNGVDILLDADVEVGQLVGNEYEFMTWKKEEEKK